MVEGKQKLRKSDKINFVSSSTPLGSMGVLLGRRTTLFPLPEIILTVLVQSYRPPAPGLADIWQWRNFHVMGKELK